MTTDLRVIGRSDEADRDIIGALEMMLERARSGAITSLAMAALQPGGDVMLYWRRGHRDSAYALLGVLDATKHVILRSTDHD